MTPAESPLAALTDATWPALGYAETGPWLIRQGGAGGKRVSAASLRGTAWAPDDIIMAESVMRDLEQVPLFCLRPSEQALDDELARRGYALIDPVVAYAAPVSVLVQTLPPLAVFPHWPPLAIARTLWAEAGIGPERLAIMERAAAPKTAILGRAGDRAAGVAFVASHGPDAMLHALEVSPALRRQGCGRNILVSAANWAQSIGAETLTLLVVATNGRARALYTSLNMQIVGQYHYRLFQPQT